MKKILIVDDSRFACKCLEQAFKNVRADVEVTSFTDSEAALEEYKGHGADYEFMVLDYNMPKLNGIELSEKIHGIEPEFPIFMLTASSAFETGAKEIPESVTVLMKPVNDQKAQEMLEAIEGKK